MEPQKMYDNEQPWDNEMGTFFVGITPRSDAIGKMERLIAGVQSEFLDKPDAFEQQLFGALTKTETAIDRDSPDTMPSDILAMMQLAEGFSLIEGDVYQIMIAPIDLGLTKIDLSCDDEGIEREVIDLFDTLDIQDCAEQNWLYCQTYGQGFPTEDWDGKNLSAIYYPNPKQIHIGSAFGFGTRDINLQTDKKLQQRLKQEENPPMWIRFGGSGWNEFRQSGMETVPLNTEVVSHLHVRKLRHSRYAIPPIARAYRTISTRQVLESMIRATIEGIMNQLWLYRKVQGEKFMRGEVAALKAEIQSTRGDKTGHLVWPDLEIEQFIPKAIDQLIANEKWQALTYHIFRQMGVNIYIVSGEKTTQGRGDPQIDIKVYMARLEHDRRNQIKWPQEVANRYMKKQGGKSVKDNPIKVWFKMNIFDAEAQIRDRLMPYVSIGLLDIQTALEEAGFDYDVILGRKKEQEQVKYMFVAPPSFSQLSLPKQGPATKTESASNFPGRTPDSQNPDVLVKASIEDYSQAISRSFEDVKKAEDDEKKRTAVVAFIATLMLTNQTHMTDAYRRGYLDSGGRLEPNADRITATVAWNNDYARNFERDLQQAILNGEDLTSFEERAGLYSPQGWQKAYLAGIFQVKRYEQGYTGWRRILHPESSQTGPCLWCIADSEVIHPIEEEFTDHPEGVCTAGTFLSFYRGGASSYPMRVPALTAGPSVGTMPR